MSRFEVFKNPVLGDFVQVCLNLCPDEVEQFEAFSGDKWDPLRTAATYSLHPGPHWVCLIEGTPALCAGFDEIRPGVWQDWMFSTPVAWQPENFRFVTRGCKRHMDVMLQTVAHRLQCVSLASRTAAHRWYGALGLQEGPRMPQYGAGRQDAIMFHRVRTL